MTPMKAIRAKCLDCCCGQVNEVRRCPVNACALHPFRFGKNPNRAGIQNSGSFAKNYGSTVDNEPATIAEGNYTPSGTVARRQPNDAISENS